MTVSERAVGIDLGSAYVRTAVLERGRPVLVTNLQGEAATPVSEAFQFASGGSRHGQLGSWFAGDLEVSPVTLLARSGVPVLESERAQAFRAIGELIARAKRDAECFVEGAVSVAAVSVPMSFTSLERRLVVDAAGAAGFQTVRLVDAPSSLAAAVPFSTLERDETCFVVDVGARTTDVAVVEVGDGILEVAGPVSSEVLGSTDFRARAEQWVARHAWDQFGVDLSSSAEAVARVRRQVEDALVQLSSAGTAQLFLPFLSEARGVPLHFQATVDREWVWSIASDLVTAISSHVRNALELAVVSGRRPSKFILAGGGSRLPYLADVVSSAVGMRAESFVSPLSSVALGSATLAGVLSGEVSGLLLLGSSPLALSIECSDGSCAELLPAGESVPTSRQEVYATSDDHQQSVRVRLLQGGSPTAGELRTVVDATASGLSPAPAGSTQVLVTVEVDVNGIVELVSAEVVGSGEPLEVVDIATRRSQEEVERLRSALAAAEVDEPDGQVSDSGDQLRGTGSTVLAEVVDALVDLSNTCLAAIGAGSDDVTQVHTPIIELLGRLGVTAVGRVGDLFDPEVHDALGVEDGGRIDGELRVVVVHRLGFRLGGRLLQPALVQVRRSG